jgi:signal transduction histidine kinase
MCEISARGCLGISWLRTAVVCLFVLFVATDEISAAELRRVLLIHAFAHAYSPWSDMAASFREEILKKSPEPIDVYELSLDTARIRNPDDELPFVEHVLKVLSGRRLDLIVPVGAPAAFFLQRHRSQLFPETPMMVLGADRRRIPRDSLGKRDTAVLSNLDLPAFFENILRVLPETKHIAVVAGNSPVERFWASEIMREGQRFADRVEITSLNRLPFGEMRKRAATMPPKSVILWILLSEDATGIPYSEDRALDKARAVANVPIFGISDYQLGRGIVGGPLLQTEVLGRSAAKVALRILKGEKPATIGPTYVGLSTPTYDWRELQRWDISEGQLPPGSIVRFREPSVWQKYRWQIMTVAAILLAQATVITALFWERWRRRIAEKGMRGCLLQVIHLNRTAVTGALSTSVAHELNQPLGAIQSYADAAMLYLKADPPDVARVEQILGNILRADERAAQIITHMRDLLKKRDEIELQECELNDIISETLKIISPEASKKGVELEPYRPNGTLLVRGDRIQLEQAILNLATNAFHAMQDSDPSRKKLAIQASLIDDATVEV